ncbi:MAG: hypothetical protein VZR13_06590 [Saccharofermentanaceae bacterium]|nr:hypothetical protein [Saccharofermentanaceae bacterium]
MVHGYGMFSRFPSSFLNVLMGTDEELCTRLNDRIRSKYDSMDNLVSRPALTPIKDPSYVQLVRIALCYYIAKADQIQPEEQAKIDAMCEDLLNNPEMNSDYRTELRMILADRGTSFNNVRRYLNRIDPSDLEAFWKDVNEMAEAADGVSDNERKALLVYESYVNERMAALRMPGSNGSGKPNIISLTCKRCSAVLDVNANLSTAFCPYCGTKHIIYEEKQ